MVGHSQHLANHVRDRDFVLFTGAGVSRTCASDPMNPPASWPELLRTLSEEFPPQGLVNHAKGLLKKQLLLELAELLKFEAKRSGREHDFVDRIVELTEGRTSAAAAENSSLMTALLDLNPRVVVTTNYDKTFEKASRSGFDVHQYDTATLGNDLRGKSDVLVKLHGCVSDRSGMILTRGDYAELRRKGSHALSAVQSLVMTRPALFVGYSLGDPDIQLLLENIVGPLYAPSSHYILVENPREYEKAFYSATYGLNVVPFGAGRFDEVVRFIRDLVTAP